LRKSKQLKREYHILSYEFRCSQKALKIKQKRIYILSIGDFKDFKTQLIDLEKKKPYQEKDNKMRISGIIEII